MKISCPSAFFQEVFVLAPVVMTSNIQKWPISIVSSYYSKRFDKVRQLNGVADQYFYLCARISLIILFCGEHPELIELVAS